MEAEVFDCGRAEKMFCEIFEFVAAEVGVISAAKFQSAVVGVFEGQAEAGEFVVEKTEVECGVVGDQGILGDEVVKFGENPASGRLVGEHFVADAVDSASPPGNRFIDLYKALEFVGQASVFNSDGTDFDNQITSLRREAGGFKIKDNKTL